MRAPLIGGPSPRLYPRALKPRSHLRNSMSPQAQLPPASAQSTDLRRLKICLNFITMNRSVFLFSRRNLQMPTGRSAGHLNIEPQEAIVKIVVVVIIAVTTNVEAIGTGEVAPSLTSIDKHLTFLRPMHRTDSASLSTLLDVAKVGVLSAHTATANLTLVAEALPCGVRFQG